MSIIGSMLGFLCQARQSFRVLLIHMDVMYAGFAGAKTCLAPYLLPVGKFANE